MHKNPGVSSYWFKSGTYTLLLQLSSILFSFGGFYVLVRQLSKEDFGVWSIYLSIAALVEVTRNGLVQNAQIKYGATATGAEYRKIMTASFALNVLYSGMVMGLVLLGAPFLSKWSSAPQLHSLLLVYLFTVMASVPVAQFNFILQANLDLKGVFINNVVRQGFFFAAVFLLAFLNVPLQLMQLALLTLAFTLLASLVGYLQTRKYLQLAAELDAKWLKKLYDYGKFSLGTSIGATLSGIVNQVLLSNLLSPASVAVYGTVTRVNSLAEVPVSTLATVVFPKSAIRAETDGKEAVRHLYEKSVAWLLALNIPVILFIQVFAHPILWIIAGEAYVHTAPYLRISILLLLLVPFTRQFGTVMDSIGKPNLNFYLLLLNAGVSVAVACAGLHLYGLPGVFWGALLSTVVATAVNLYFLRRELQVSLLNVLYYMKLFYGKEAVAMASASFRFVAGRRSAHP